MCVWSTGVAPVPLVTALAKEIPEQTNRRALITDEYMRVKGADSIFALGDCSTVTQVP